MADTRIDWADKVWNPITGCTPVSPGCQNCYARRMAQKFRGRCGYPADEPFQVTLRPERLGEPLRWRKPARIFVDSMGDLFHEDVPTAYIHRVWDVIKACPHHIFIVLTKRPQRMKEALEDIYSKELLGAAMGFWRHVWLGVTAENQEMADKRIPILLQIPAAVRFVSVEPMLGRVDLIQSINQLDWLDPVYWKPGGIDWVVCGGETGPGARPMHPDWARSLRDQCVSAGVPFFFKQWGDATALRSTADHLLPKVLHLPKEKHGGRLLDGQEWRQVPESKY